ncbi:MAG: ABC transporter permease, partial [Muribaculaceae bacterium]|nr:ABC transporter permease [Muribaculaceae bacterium]
IVMKEGSSEQKLENEMDELIRPFGVKAELTRIVDKPDFKRIIPIKIIVYVIGSLILLAAVIGFLRIESQLFSIRRRELALRVVNGASRMQIFGCLVTEVIMTICISILLAMLLGGMLQDFLEEKLNLGMGRSFLKGLFEEGGLIPYSLLTGGALLILSIMTAWCMILQIFKERQGLEMSIRRKSTHLMRNTMLGIQIIISMVFVCSAFILLKGGDWILRVCNVPENDNRYAECLYMDFRETSDHERMIEEIKRLPDLEIMIGCPRGTTIIQETIQNPEIMEKLNDRLGYRCYFTEDSTVLSFLGIEVEWLTRNLNRNECMLIGEKAFNRFKEIGLLDNMALTLWNQNEALPIGGIIKKFPYDMYGENLVILGSDPNQVLTQAILVPKEGKGKALWKSVEQVIERLEPELFTKIVYSYRERENPFPLTVELARACGWIAGGISIIICAMSILSTIALDTRARRKEVAIRKVNGAKRRDIYRIFGRIYAFLIVVSLAIAIPVCILINRWVENYINDSVPESTHLSPVGPIILGCAIVITLIFIIVGWQIHRMMQINPARIITKE